VDSAISATASLLVFDGFNILENGIINDLEVMNFHPPNSNNLD